MIVSGQIRAVSLTVKTWTEATLEISFLELCGETSAARTYQVEVSERDGQE